MYPYSLYCYVLKAGSTLYNSLYTGSRFQQRGPVESSCSLHRCKHPRARLCVVCDKCGKKMHCICAGIPTKVFVRKALFTFVKIANFFAVINETTEHNSYKISVLCMFYCIV